MFSPAKVIGLERTEALAARVAAKVVVNAETGCHLWMGAVSTTRRGHRPIMCMRNIRRVIRVARLVLEWKAGPPPDDLYEAGHTCPKGENQLCVNPDHLEWMTREENEAHKRTYTEDVA